MNFLKCILIFFITINVINAQDWYATSVWTEPVPVTNINGCIALVIPTTYKNPSKVALFTTTNTQSLLGDLTGATIEATFDLVITNDAVIYYGSDYGDGTRSANVRLYFTSTTEPYNLNNSNGNPDQYWWADYAVAYLSVDNYMPALAGTYTLTAALDPALWSDSHGHWGATSPSFTNVVSRIAQIGFSFGGGDFFDTGVGIYDAYGNNPEAILYLRNYSVLRPTISISKYDVVNGVALLVKNTMPSQTYTVQYSSDLNNWTDLSSVILSGASFTFNDASATNSAQGFYRLK